MKYNMSKVPLFINGAYVNERFINIDDSIVKGVYPYYLISNYGRVYHLYTRKFLSPGLETSGYLCVSLSTNSGPKNCLIHRLVMLAFNPVYESDKLQVNHINGIKTDNVITNLEWCTRSENIKHSYRTGLHPIESSLEEEDVIKICEMLNNGYMITQISEITGISQHIIKHLKSSECVKWKHITDNYSFDKRVGRLLDEQTIRKICEYFQNNPRKDNQCVNDLCRDALNFIGYDCNDKTVDTVRKIYGRKYYTKISKDYNY